MSQSSTIVTLNPQASTPMEEEPKAQRLPIPKGWKLLIALPKVDTTFDGGIVKAEATVRQEEVSHVVGFVVSMGPDAYQDKTKFPSGAFCKVGDFVLIGAFKGTRFKIEGEEMRLINDDTVEAVVRDPRGYTRA
jgi:co-chaperonin GroES (HSP10)